MTTYPKTVDEMLALTDIPVVAIDQESNFTFVNKAFEAEYGWSLSYLLGKPVTVIMPEHMQGAHTVGFSRYLATEKSELLGTQLPLQVVYKDGRTEVADHYILSDKQPDGRWIFAAIIDYPNKNG